MKKHQILIIAMGLIFTACEKDSGSKFFAGPGEIPAIAEISITATSAEGGPAIAKIRGYFGFEPANQFEPTGSLTIEGETPDYDNSNKRYHQRYYADNPVPQNWYGSTISITAYDSEFGDMDIDDFYIPELVVVDQSVQGNFTNIDRSDGLDISWNADGNNSNPVVISIIYRPIRSQDDDPNMPSSLQHSVVIETEDDGSHHVPASELEPFPVGSHLSLTVGRGNGDRYETSGGKFAEIAAFTLDDLKAVITQP